MTTDVSKPPTHSDARTLANGHPDEVRTRAISLVLQSPTIAAAYRALRDECQAKNVPAPAYHKVWQWAKEGAVTPQTFVQRKEIAELMADVVADYAESMVERKHELKPHQIPIAYGIASDKLSGLLNAPRGQGAGGLNITFNIRNRDGDTLNNDISNLGLVTAHDHLSNHARSSGWPTPEHMDAIRPLAAEWHRSHEGRKWHQEHGKRTWAKRRPVSKTCSHCGSVYETKVSNTRGAERFCSGRCCAAHRRASGLDNEERLCPACGATWVSDLIGRRVAWIASITTAITSPVTADGRQASNREPIEEAARQRTGGGGTMSG